MRYPSLTALLIQVATWFILLAFLVFFSIEIELIELVFCQGVFAAVTSYYMRMAVWWFFIHLFFAPAIFIALTFNLPPLSYLTAFVLFILIYGSIHRTQVPLYPSSKAVANVITTLFPKNKAFSLIDLGSGGGKLLTSLSKLNLNGNFHGVEAAILPFLASRVRGLFSQSNCSFSWGNFWQYNLSSYDIVYAYLSPAPMDKLWKKALQEMRPGSILISNSFIVPDVPPTESIAINDFNNSVIYIWKI